MPLKLESSNLDAYLESSDVINCKQIEICETAIQLSHAEPTEIAKAKRIYEFVRDQISHTFDIQGEIVTCTASEVLQYRQGICFAKSHLLAAMLRSVGIPTGLCCQRLVCEQGQGPEFTLHGLNAIYLVRQCQEITSCFLRRVRSWFDDVIPGWTEGSMHNIERCHLLI